MKNTLKILIIGALFLFLCSPLTANAVLITDEYIGADPTSSSYDGFDRIGDAAFFEVYGMSVDITPGTGLLVSIQSSYFDNIGKYYTQLGDLFISTDGYHPFNPSENDYYANGEDWEYAFVLDDHLATSGSGNLYEVDKASGGAIVMSSAPSGYIYRAGQEVRYTPYAEQYGTPGSWFISDSKDWLTMNIPWLTAWDNVGLFGFHWTMTCANDVIEGAAPVPEPETLMLLGTGLFGLAVVARKRHKP